MKIDEFKRLGNVPGLTEIVLNLDAVPKPRMTRRDKWKQRPCVLQYRQFCDRLRALVGLEAWAVIQKSKTFPTFVGWAIEIEMTPGWSLKKQKAMAGQPHDLRPDRDNFDKAILDALFDEDRRIYAGVIGKFWAPVGEKGRITLWLGNL